VQDQTLVN